MRFFGAALLGRDRARLLFAERHRVERFFRCTDSAN